MTAGHTQNVLVDRRCPLGHGSRGWRKCGDQAGAGPGLRVTEVNEQPGWLEGPGPKDQGAGGLQGREMGIPIQSGKARGTGQGGGGQSSFREGRRRLAPWRRGLPCDDSSPGPLGVFTALRQLLQPCQCHPCVVSDSGILTLDPKDCSLPGSSVLGDSPDKNTGVSRCHFLLQGIFPTQGLNPCLLRLLLCRQVHYR